MALKAGYYGIKKNIKNRLEKVLQFIPSSASADNPLVTQSEINDVYKINGVLGAKNLLPMTLADIKTRNTAGLWRGGAYTFRSVTYTFTVNDAGYVTQVSTSGTATGGTSYIVLKYDYVFKAGTSYTISGCGEYGQEVWIGLYDTATSQYADATSKNGVDTSFSYDADTTRQIRIRIAETIVTDTFVFYPMIRLAADTDPTYASFAMTNQQLTASIAELTASAADQKTAINAIITAATEAADFAAFKTAMGAITPVTRSLQASAPDTREITDEPVVEKTTTKKTTKKSAKVEEE